MEMNAVKMRKKPEFDENRRAFSQTPDKDTRLRRDSRRRRGCCPRKERGQMTVEFAVAFPVFIAIAVIAVNALLFFADCAAFDRVARDAIRVCATSPSYGSSSGQVCSQIQAAIQGSLREEGLESEVSAVDQGMGHTAYTAKLRFSPTLFGLGFKSVVFGVSLPKLSHQVVLCVDPYKPGVFL